MTRIVVAGLAIALAACGSSADPTPTPAPAASVAPGDRDRAERAVAAFLELMADPEVTYRATGQLRAGAVDDEDRPDILVNTSYDVKGGAYAGSLDVHLRDPTVGGGFRVAVVDGVANLSFPSIPDRTESGEAPGSLARPDAIQELTADDLTLLRVTDDGSFEFRVVPWIGGDPIGQWVDLGAVPEESLPRTEMRSHDTRLILDAAGFPLRLLRSWSFSIGDSTELVSASLVEEFEGFGMYVDLDGPFDAFGTTSFDTEAGPWRQIPVPDGPSASVEVAFPDPDEPIVLGIEGAVFFLRSHDPGGDLIRDEILDSEGATIEIGTGDQTIVAYYRTCNGACGSLDPASDFCSVEAEVAAGARYELIVRVLGPERADCTFERIG